MLKYKVTRRNFLQSSAIGFAGLMTFSLFPTYKTEAAEPGKRMLVVYFSMPETSDPNNMTEEEANSTVVIDGKVFGNTQYMANVIRETTGADIFRIEPSVPYTTNHAKLIAQAQDEQDRKFRPALKSKIENLQNYDIIFLGYPTWWYELPMPLYSFLEQHDLSGKIIVPFNTHGGSGFSTTVSTIGKLQPKATVRRDGLTISRDRIQNAKAEIVAWVNKLKF